MPPPPGSRSRTEQSWSRPAGILPNRMDVNSRAIPQGVILISMAAQGRRLPVPGFPTGNCPQPCRFTPDLTSELCLSRLFVHDSCHHQVFPLRATVRNAPSTRTFGLWPDSGKIKPCINLRALGFSASELGRARSRPRGLFPAPVTAAAAQGTRHVPVHSGT